jgi:sulfur relay (sulfurtransferase) complex TusBCD TusD component (DsrE family)
VRTLKQKEADKRYYANHRDEVIARNIAWQKSNPDRTKNIGKRTRAKNRIKRMNARFKNPEAYAHFIKQLEKQKNACAICRRGLIVEIGPAGDPMLGCQDHDHENDQLRGALCNRCNKALGLFDENLERMSVAIRYLEHWKKFLTEEQ